MSSHRATADLDVTTEHAPLRADQLAEVLLPELVRALQGVREPGTVLGGRPHLRLFGEAIDVALPLRALRRLGESSLRQPLSVDAQTLALHARAMRDPEGYVVSTAGLHVRAPVDDVPPDAMSLQLYASPLYYPLNALVRADPARPETWLAAVAGLRGAAQRILQLRYDARHGRVEPSDDGLAQRLARLRARTAGLSRLDDPRLPRLLGEQIVHALMAWRALWRQRPLEHAQAERVHRACTLPEAALADLRWAASTRGVWRDPGFSCTSPTAAHSRRRGRGEHPHALELVPLARGSAGRWIDGSIDGVVAPEPLVVFPPGAPFAVTEVVELAGRDGGPGRLVARLEEAAPGA